ncbi:heme biosynthesis HemY N-terminal domain-containing protein [Zooshikella ganghwensis]|uniref:Heme biosynthesis protein HemY n=1 Tax=Zooshikella ganghwensis TaxID=202772 RepID=A0A4P9VR28_9GAMM|nr:heme biosynthesis HemY N-terminal domain-containing protein [Zooshikella ganghwensis]RDH46038.1 heme biosynthesis protein HemY [Zooshikella ganghwensis]
MKIFFYFLLLLLSIAAIITGMNQDQGYVRIAWDGMVFESTLWMLFVFMGIGFFGYKALRWLISLLLSTTGWVVPITSSSRQQRAKRQSVRGLNCLINGQWDQAQRLLSKSAEQGEAPLINYLAAARAAFEAGDSESVSDYLRKADKSVSGAKVGVGIAQAQLQLSAGQFEQALATLQELRRKVPRHKYVLKLLKQVCIRLNDWDQLAELLPVLERRKVISDDELKDLQQRTWKSQLEQACQRSKVEDKDEDRASAIQAVWDSLPRQAKHEVSVVEVYVRCLLKLNAHVVAEKVVREALGRNYDDRLIKLYGLTAGKDVKKQLALCDQLLASYPDNPEIMLALGRLCLRSEMWGKARSYFESTLKVRKTPEVYNELGRLLAHLGDHQQSTEHFREGLALVARSDVTKYPTPIAKQPAA